MKFNNREVKLQVYNSNGKLKKEIKYRNRILNNYLDFMTYRALPTSIGDSIYSKFTNTALGETRGLYKTYLKFDIGQIISPDSTTMLFDLDLQSNFILLEDIESDFITTPNEVQITHRYEYDVEAINDGKQLVESGFGLNNGDYTDYLLAHIDLQTFDIFIFEGDKLVIIRDDFFRTDGEFTQVTSEIDFANHLGFSNSLLVADRGQYSQMTKVGFSYGDGSTVVDEYDINSLTVTDSGNAGEVTITGFSNFPTFTGSGLYPSDDLYPSDTLYPEGTQYKSAVFTYERQDATTSPKYTGNGETYEIVILIKDLDVSYSDGTLTITYKHERGDV